LPAIRSSSSHRRWPFVEVDGLFAHNPKPTTGGPFATTNHDHPSFLCRTGANPNPAIFLG
jgi:hypothetical protein